MRFSMTNAKLRRYFLQRRREIEPRARVMIYIILGVIHGLADTSRNARCSFQLAISRTTQKTRTWLTTGHSGSIKGAKGPGRWSRVSRVAGRGASRSVRRAILAAVTPARDDPLRSHQ